MFKNKKKRYLIFVLTFLLLLIIVFLIYYFNKSKILINNTPPLSNQLIKDQAGELKNDLSNFNKAQETENIDLCLLVENPQSKDFCFEELAIKKEATSSCLLINNEDLRSNCSSLILLNQAEKGKSLPDCELIEQPMLIQTCIERIAENNLNVDCNLVKEIDLRLGCFSIVLYQQAKSANDIKICEKIPELIKRANCLSEVGKIDLHSDADKDGLDFLQEIINNTDPNNPDTDGDGFKDGDEFKSGFNPDGEGRLGIPVLPNIIACKDIKDIETQSACFIELKNQFFDVNKCDELKDPKLKKLCLTMPPVAPKK